MLHCLTAAADDQQPLVKEGGHVKYTVQFAAGAEPIPSLDTMITLETDGMTPTGSIQCTDESRVLPVPGPINNVTIHGKSWVCSFDIHVNSTHQSQGQIAPFKVQVKFNGTASSLTAFYVPKIEVPVVYVYTGATLTYQESHIDATYNSLAGQLALQFDQMMSGSTVYRFQCL